MKYFPLGKHPDEEERRLLQSFRECDRDGKDVILRYAVKERRRSQGETTKIVPFPTDRVKRPLPSTPTKAKG